MLEELNLFIHLNRRLRQDFISVFSYIIGDFKETEAGTSWRHTVKGQEISDTLSAKNVVIIH